MRGASSSRTISGTNAVRSSDSIRSVWVAPSAARNCGERKNSSPDAAAPPSASSAAVASPTR